MLELREREREREREEERRDNKEGGRVNYSLDRC